MVTHTQRGISLPGDDTHDCEANITVQCENEAIADKVLMHTKDELIRAMQACEELQHPDECDGGMMSINWEKVIEENLVAE